MSFLNYHLACKAAVCALRFFDRLYGVTLAALFDVGGLDAGLFFLHLNVLNFEFMIKHYKLLWEVDLFVVNSQKVKKIVVESKKDRYNSQRRQIIKPKIFRLFVHIYCKLRQSYYVCYVFV